MIDSPVGKTAEFAVQGKLTLMVGGPADAIARCRPVLDCMGTDFFHCGELGAGESMKLINNLLATVLLEASAEALVAGVKSGLTLETMLSVMKTTMAWNNQMAMAMQRRPLVGDFQPGFMLKLAHKDCRLALADVRQPRRVGERGTCRARKPRRRTRQGHGPARRRRAPEAARGGGARARAIALPHESYQREA